MAGISIFGIVKNQKIGGVKLNCGDIILKYGGGLMDTKKFCLNDED